jgi:hypothetical protein
MPVLALWSAPRARSTAFFRSMLERGDLLCLHEPVEGLVYFGSTEIDGRTFESPESLLGWLREAPPDIGVFMKETTDVQVLEAVCAEPGFLASARHALLVRRPEEIAASLLAATATFEQPDREVRSEDIGLEALSELKTAIEDVGGHPPIVIDSDDLVGHPRTTMAAYCDAMELSFMPDALTWEPGERREWQRSSRWHVAVSASTGFEPRAGRGAVIDLPERLARFAAHHRPFYEELRSQRIDIAAR